MFPTAILASIRHAVTLLLFCRHCYLLEDSERYVSDVLRTHFTARATTGTATDCCKPCAPLSYDRGWRQVSLRHDIRQECFATALLDSACAIFPCPRLLWLPKGASHTRNSVACSNEPAGFPARNTVIEHSISHLFRVDGLLDFLESFGCSLISLRVEVVLEFRVLVGQRDACRQEKAADGPRSPRFHPRNRPRQHVSLPRELHYHVGLPNENSETPRLFTICTNDCSRKNKTNYSEQQQSNVIARHQSRAAAQGVLLKKLDPISSRQSHCHCHRQFSYSRRLKGSHDVDTSFARASRAQCFDLHFVPLAYRLLRDRPFRRPKERTCRRER